MQLFRHVEGVGSMMLEARLYPRLTDCKCTHVCRRVSCMQARQSWHLCVVSPPMIMLPMIWLDHQYTQGVRYPVDEGGRAQRQCCSTITYPLALRRNPLTNLHSRSRCHPQLQQVTCMSECSWHDSFQRAHYTPTVEAPSGGGTPVADVYIGHASVSDESYWHTEQR